MNKKILPFLLLGIVLSTISFGQGQKNYEELVNEAWKLYESKEFLESAKTYSKAFVSHGDSGRVNDRYNAACSWALANKSDSAFAQLFRVATNGGYTNLRHITSDPDLSSLHSESNWKEVIKLVKANKEKEEINFDKPLVAILDTIYEEDQKYRRQISEIEKEYGWDSEEMQAHWKIIAEKDSINLIKVKKIIDERGWLGADIIGKPGNSALFLVIQHADLETQQKYLPLMREAVKIGNASARNLALLEDRVALGLGERQIYGSQIGHDSKTEEYYVLPLDDPDNVDKRRAEVGLGELKDYVSNWGIIWDLEKYKRKLPEIEANMKESK